MQTENFGIRNNYILFLFFISSLGGYLFGFDFAVIAGALPFLKQQFGFDEVWDGFATASLALGCIVGCLIAGSIADKRGRKPGLMMAAAIFLISSLAMAVATSKEVFTLARAIAGMGVGMASMLSPLYIAEMAPAESRGRMVAINQLTIVLGILITNIINYYLKDIGPDAWRWMVGLGAVPSGLFLLGVTILPESPRFLMLNGKESEANTVLSKIGNQHYVNTEMETIKKYMAKAPEKKDFSEVFSKAVLPSVLVGIGLAVFQQFCGINVVFNFTTTIFESIGFSTDDQLKQTIFIGIVNLVCTLLAMWQVDKLGRKPLMLFGSIGLAIMYLISAVLLQNKSPLAFIPLLTCIGIYAMSLAPVTWILISEIFPSRVRGAATSVAVISLWAAYAILVFTFPIIAKRMGTYVPFYIFSLVCLVGSFFVHFKVKETKGKSLEDIEDNPIIGH
jgi:MFS transporter, SP family, xylose:H+ symportor